MGILFKKPYKWLRNKSRSENIEVAVSKIVTPKRIKINEDIMLQKGKYAPDLEEQEDFCSKKTKLSDLDDDLVVGFLPETPKEVAERPRILSDISEEYRTPKEKAPPKLSFKIFNDDSD